MKIIVTDGYVENPGDLSWAPLEALGEVTYYDRIGLTDEDETIRRIGDAEIAVINKAPVTRKVIDSCPNLKLITVMATGYNVVDIACGVRHTAAVLSDGHCVATGDNSRGQCAVGDWENVVMIACGEFHTAGVTADGRVLVAGNAGGYAYIWELLLVLAVLVEGEGEARILSCRNLRIVIDLGTTLDGHEITSELLDSDRKRLSALCVRKYRICAVDDLTRTLCAGDHGRVTALYELICVILNGVRILRCINQVIICLL